MTESDPVVTTWTASAFETMSWHDCVVHGWSVQDENDQLDVVLDLDFILRWNCDTHGRCTFEVAPAELRFHCVTDLRITLDWGTRMYRDAPGALTIREIQRQRVGRHGAMPASEYFHWSIGMSVPANGEMAFGASGFTQVRRGGVATLTEQSLTTSERRKLLARA